MLLVSETPRANMGLTQPRIYCVMGVKRPERKVKHSPSSNTEVRNEWRYTSIPPIRHNDVHRYKCTFFNTEVVLHNRQQITIPYTPHTGNTGSSAANQFTREPDKEIHSEG
jgi:hypothetical protein